MELSLYDRHRFDEFWTVIDGIDPAHLDVIQAPEIWSIADVIDHLVDAETQSYVRLRSALYDLSSIIPNHDENRWQASTRPHYSHAHARSLIDGIRQANHDLLATLDAAALERTGMHTTAGPVSVRQLFQIYDDHVGTHLWQVHRLLANITS